MDPLVSVIMSVFNGEQYVGDAIESILNQTYGNWELIIIDDGSYDLTAAIIGQHKDSRIKFLSHKNMGLTRSLNRGIREAHGKYIARLDADDRSLPKRLEKQVAYLENNLDCVLLGSSYLNLDLQSMNLSVVHPPIQDELCRKTLKWGNSIFLHSSVMFRKKISGVSTSYDENFKQGQDQRLWITLATKGKISTLPEPLSLALRNDANSITYKRSELKGFLLKARLAWIAAKELKPGHPTFVLAFLYLMGFSCKAKLKKILVSTCIISSLKTIFNRQHEQPSAIDVVSLWKTGIYTAKK